MSVRCIARVCNIDCVQTKEMVAILGMFGAALELSDLKRKGMMATVSLGGRHSSRCGESMVDSSCSELHKRRNEWRTTVNMWRRIPQRV